MKILSQLLIERLRITFTANIKGGLVPRDHKFPLYFTLTFDYTEIISFMPCLSIRIGLSRFY